MAMDIICGIKQVRRHQIANSIAESKGCCSALPTLDWALPPDWLPPPEVNIFIACKAAAEPIALMRFIRQWLIQYD
jgi:hypothetical protein